MSEVVRPIGFDDFGGAPQASNPVLAADIAEAVYSLVARHTNAPCAAIYTLPVENVLAIHTGARITTESAAIVYGHLVALLCNSLESSWLMVEPASRRLEVVTVRQALAELIR